MTQINNLTDFYMGLIDTGLTIDEPQVPVGTQKGPVSMLNGIELITHATVIAQAIKDIREYEDRMSIDGRTIQHIADSLGKLIK